MTTITTRPIIINDSSTITQIDKERLVYKFNNINLLNVQKFNDSNLKIRGIQFYVTPSNNSVLKFKNINYIFSSYIITENIDIIDQDNAYEYCLMIELVTTTLSNKLFLVLPINNDNKAGTNDDNDNFVKDMFNFITENSSDLTNSNNIVFNKFKDIDDNLKDFSPNNLIPGGAFYKYIFKDSVSKMSTFIVYPTTSSKIYVDIPTDFSSTIDGILNTTNTYTETSAPPTSIYKHKKGSIKKDITDTNLFEDIYIDCSPVSESTGNIIKQNKVFSLRNIFNSNKEKNKLSIDSGGNVVDNKGTIMSDYSVDSGGNIVDSNGKIVNQQSTNIQDDLFDVNWMFMGIIFSVLICLSGYYFIKNLEKLSEKDLTPKTNSNIIKKGSIILLKLCWDSIKKLNAPYIIITLLTAVLLLSGEKGKEIPLISWLVDPSQTGGVPLYPFFIIFGLFSLIMNLKEDPSNQSNEQNVPNAQKTLEQKNLEPPWYILIFPISLLLLILYLFIMIIMLIINKLFSILLPDSGIGTNNMDNTEKYISILFFTILIPLISIKPFKKIIEVMNTIFLKGYNRIKGKNDS